MTLNSSNKQSLYTLMLSSVDTMGKNVLIIADENTSSDFAPQSMNFSSVTIISNRFDVYDREKQRAATHNSNTVLYSDFDFTALKPLHGQNTSQANFDIIFFRIPKERALCHWVLNNLSSILRTGGQIILAGRKDEGIKNYAGKCTKVLGLTGKLRKSGKDYLAVLSRCGDTRPLTEEVLDDKNYPKIRAIGNAFGFKLYSKPGVYGWDKIDEGSEFLIDVTLPALRQHATKGANQALDLGCGYGYLSLALLHCGFKAVTASDNNAAAIEATRHNALMNSLCGLDVVAASCANTIDKTFDCILCNPPFHQGFTVESRLSEDFIQASARLLASNGNAYFVVNAFIPIEKIARKYFRSILCLANNQHFKVLEMKSPRK